MPRSKRQASINATAKIQAATDDDGNTKVGDAETGSTKLSSGRRSREVKVKSEAVDEDPEEVPEQYDGSSDAEHYDEDEEDGDDDYESSRKRKRKSTPASKRKSRSRKISPKPSENGNNESTEEPQASERTTSKNTKTRVKKSRKVAQTPKSKKTKEPMVPFVDEDALDLKDPVVIEREEVFSQVVEKFSKESGYEFALADLMRACDKNGWKFEKVCADLTDNAGTYMAKVDGNTAADEDEDGDNNDVGDAEEGTDDAGGDMDEDGGEVDDAEGEMDDAEGEVDEAGGEVDDAEGEMDVEDEMDDGEGEVDDGEGEVDTEGTEENGEESVAD